VEGVAICADEGWDLSELVDLEVLSRNALGRLGLDYFDVDVVGLCNSTNSSGAGVTLAKLLAFGCLRCFATLRLCIPGRCRTFRKAFLLSLCLFCVVLEVGRKLEGKSQLDNF
jgi:hypothetical protein